VKGRTPTWYHKETLLDLKSHIRKKECRILDVGCGQGIIENIAPHSYEIFGLDISLNALNEAKKHRRGFYVCGDIGCYPFKVKQFDAILLHQVIEHFQVKKRRDILRCCCRLLKPNGIMILSTVIKGPFCKLSHLKGRNSIGEFHKGEYNSVGEIMQEVNELEQPLKLIKIKRKFVRARVFQIKVPLLLYYDDVYLVFRRLVLANNTKSSKLS